MAKSFRNQHGFSLVEILVTLVIVMIGLLGLAGVQMRAHQGELESYQRAQALILVSDMVDRLNANRKNLGCYTVAYALGTNNSTVPSCTSGLLALQQIAIDDLTAWDSMLKGAGETAGGVSIGAMIGARGCITFDAALGMYRVSVAWQGIAPTEAPDAAGAPGTDVNAVCGKNLYGDERLRREVGVYVRIADLS